MAYRFIADEITTLEQAAGFEKIMIQNPNGHYFLEAPEIPAVICE